MNCTKCGKEIPDGETQICEECQKNILEEIKNAEEYDGKQKETKKENFSKSNEKNKNNFSIKKCIIIIALLLIIVVAIFVIYNYKENNNNNNLIGNSIANIRNYGYLAESGNYIYYLLPNADTSQVGIFSSKKDGTNQKELFMSDSEINQEIVSINVYKDYIYFIGTYIFNIFSL